MKYFEKRGIYYPAYEIESKPFDIGLDYEEVFFKTEDGLNLNSWFIPAKSSRATLLFCHGNAGNISHRVEIIRIFNRLGLNVFIFDYRGYGKSQGAPGEEGLYKDARAAYDYLLSREDVDNQKIIIYGKSIGANVAINLACGVKAGVLISESGFTSAYDMGKKLFPWLPIKWIISIKYNALEKIAGIKLPKLIIHSRNDEIVPFELGKRLFEAAPEPKEFYVMQGTHNQAIFTAVEEYTARLDSFLNKYFPSHY
ncbi:MAG: alpha/beta hydrolase [Candidatus Omnitrophota bacterium]